MELPWIVGIGGVLGTILASVLGYVAAHRTSGLSSKQALDARIDERVTEQLSSAWARIDHLENQLREIAKSQSHIRRAARSWFTRLVAWDKKGRPGKLPVPSEAEMDELGILDLVIVDETGEIELLEITEPDLSPRA